MKNSVILERVLIVRLEDNITRLNDENNILLCHEA